MTKPPLRVGVLAYEGCFGAEVFGVLDLLTVANLVVAATTGVEPFAVSVLAAQRGAIATASAVTLGATSVSAVANGRWRQSVDLVVVPGFAYLPGIDLDRVLAGWQAEIAFLRRSAAHGVPLASVCVGTFLLGEAGLLDGRRATTAWLAADALAERYPASTVLPSAVLVEDGPITTVAAFSAGFDLSLHLVRQYAGEAAARRTARVTLIPSSRNSQAPYVDNRMLSSRAGSFATKVRTHLLTRLADPYDLTALSHAFHVSTRTMLRRFRAETGETPLTFLQSARVAHAQRLLESSDLAITEIMRTAGYQDARTFRQLFAERVGLSPAAYRQAFRTNEHSSESPTSLQQ